MFGVFPICAMQMVEVGEVYYIQKTEPVRSLHKKVAMLKLFSQFLRSLLKHVGYFL